jgi:hypothetical protein
MNNVSLSKVDNVHGLKTKSFLTLILWAVSGIFFPNGLVSKELSLLGHGERLLPGATTDVWVHRDFAYLGTFNQPCGDGTGKIKIWNVGDPVNPPPIGNG